MTNEFDRRLFSVGVVVADGTVTARLKGELDLAAQPELLSVVGGLLDQRPEVPVVLDMSDVTFIDSCGISALLVLNQQTADGGRFEIRNPSAQVRHVLEVTNLVKYLHLTDDPSSQAV